MREKPHLTSLLPKAALGRPTVLFGDQLKNIHFVANGMRGGVFGEVGWKQKLEGSDSQGGYENVTFE